MGARVQEESEVLERRPLIAEGGHRQGRRWQAKGRGRASRGRQGAEMRPNYTQYRALSLCIERPVLVVVQYRGIGVTILNLNSLNIKLHNSRNMIPISNSRLQYTSKRVLTNSL